MKVQIIFLIALLASCKGAIDLTLVPIANGPYVVEAVVAIIQEKCVFEDDALMLRRWAKASTNDGQASDTFSTGFYGGIWKITETKYLETKKTNLAILTSIRNEFGIEWSTTTWQDLLKPLYSALAARLSIKKVPKGLKKQASLWSSISGSPANVYIESASFIEPICDATADIVFIVDGSGSIHPENFKIMKDFMKNLVRNLNVGTNKTRVALLTFSDNVHLQFDLNQHLSTSEVLGAIDKIRQPFRGTNTHIALDYARDNIFLPSKGARDWAPRIAITITDGESNHEHSTLISAQRLLASEIISFAIGVGSNLRISELKTIASDLDCNYLTILEGFNEFASVAAQIEKRLCEVNTEVKNGTINILSPGGKKYYTYILKGACQALKISITGGKAVIFQSQNYQPSPAKYDEKSDLTPEGSTDFFGSGSGQLYLTVVAASQSTVTFTTFSGQCTECPDGKVLKQLKPPFSSCEVITAMAMSTGSTMFSTLTACLPISYLLNRFLYIPI